MDEDDDRPLRILVLDTRAPARGIVAGTLAKCGHSCDQAWSMEHALALVSPGRYDALICTIAAGQPRLAAYGKVLDRLGPVREMALVAIVPAYIPGQDAQIFRAGFDRLLIEPFPPDVLDGAVRDAVRPLRRPPPLARRQRDTLREAGGEAALEDREGAVDSAAEALVIAVDQDAAAITAAALLLAEACLAAGFPAAAAAARQLAAEPERPYAQRALASALGGARSAARAERLRRAAGHAI
ncbi:MAG TPA: hypothetical protein VD970_02430 [Acetobacteraceae bacterium]|nr:hypothetical protein [Acetobacteraceae bacterium]